MTDLWLECIACEQRVPFAPLFRGCSTCGAELEVRYRLERVAFPPVRSRAGVWRWEGWLPAGILPPLNLCEGDAPLLPLRQQAARPAIFVKDETRNPTWSWKDRPNSVTAALARHFKFSRLAVISTGNHGVAAAAFAAANGLACTVFCHEEAPVACTSLMTRFGARVVRGGNQEAALEAELAGGDTFPGTTLDPSPGFTNPFGVEGFKTIAFEVVEQLGGKAPDRVYVPTGSGDGLYGVWKGFRELQQGGFIERAPRMIACQAAGADSLARAFLARRKIVEPIPRVSTRALSIGERRTGNQALRAVYQSGGSVELATDEQAAAAAQVLCHQGTAIELASAVALACAMRDQHHIRDDHEETWIVIASGAVTKWLTGDWFPDGPEFFNSPTSLFKASRS